MADISSWYSFPGRGLWSRQAWEGQSLKISFMSFCCGLNENAKGENSAVNNHQILKLVLQE